MREHSKEPWKVEETHVCGQLAWEITSDTDLIVAGESGTPLEDARRIVACVNACAGKTTEELEAIDPDEPVICPFCQH